MHTETKATFEWNVDHGITYLALPRTEGKKGDAWISELKEKGIRFEESTEKLLLSKYFVATNGIRYRMAIIHGASTKDVLEKAEVEHFIPLSLEAACQVRNLSREDLAEMGLQNVNIYFKDIVTDASNCILEGKPLCLLIGSHPLHEDYFYCLPYSLTEQSSDGVHAVFLVP